jgi:hypothetical protein
MRWLLIHRRVPLAPPGRARPKSITQLQRIECNRFVPAPLALSAQLFDRGRNDLLEGVNRGGVTLRNVRCELPRLEVATRLQALRPAGEPTQPPEGTCSRTRRCRCKGVLFEPFNLVSSPG